MSNLSDSGSSTDRLVINIKQEPLDEISDCESTKSYYASSTPPALGSFLGRGGVQRIRHRYGSHIKQSVSPDTCVCEVCQSEFVGPQLLQGHKLCHFNSQHVCYVCDTYFPQCDSLVLHMATIHHQLNPQTQGLGNEKEWFVCPICLQKFSSKTSLVNHQRQHANKEKQNDYPCRVCGIEYDDSRQLRDHLISSRHLEMKVKIQSVFVCVDCRSIFANRDAYAMHMMMRAQNEICQVSDVTMKSLNGQPNTIDQTIKSNKINEPAVLKWNIDKNNILSYRMNAIQKTNTFTCNKCMQCFNTQDSLALHMMMHSQSEAPKYNVSRPSSVPVDKEIIKHPLSSWLCKICLTYCDSCDSLAMHMMMKHSNTETQSKLENNCENTDKNMNPSIEPRRSLAIIRPCSVDTAATALQNKKHLSEERNKRSRSVDDDEVLMRKKQLLESDVSNKYTSSLRPPSTTLKCSGCLRIFQDQIQWTNHIMKVLNMKDNYYCHKCNISFTNSEHFFYHKRSIEHEVKQNEAKQSSCSICGWSNISTALVTHHVQTQHAIVNTTTEDCVQADPHLQEALTFIRSQDKKDQPINLCNRLQRQAIESTTDIPIKLNKRKTFIPSKNTMYSPEPSERSYSTHSPPTQVPGPVSQSGISTSDNNDDDVVEFVLANASELQMCKHCNIIYMDKMLYQLHMGLHNLNDPWQCNMCGHKCKDLHTFTSHVLHN